MRQFQGMEQNITIKFHKIKVEAMVLTIAKFYVPHVIIKLGHTVASVEIHQKMAGALASGLNGRLAIS